MCTCLCQTRMIYFLQIQNPGKAEIKVLFTCLDYNHPMLSELQEFSNVLRPRHRYIYTRRYLILTKVKIWIAFFFFFSSAGFKEHALHMNCIEFQPRGTVQRPGPVILRRRAVLSPTPVEHI